MDSTDTQEKIEINLNSPIWTFQKENVEEWKKQNLIDIQKRLNGWQLESFKESYKHKIEKGISLIKKESMK